MFVPPIAILIDHLSLSPLPNSPYLGLGLPFNSCDSRPGRTLFHHRLLRGLLLLLHSQSLYLQAPVLPQLKGEEERKREAEEATEKAVECQEGRKGRACGHCQRGGNSGPAYGRQKYRSASYRHYYTLGPRRYRLRWQAAAGDSAVHPVGGDPESRDADRHGAGRADAT